MNQPHPIIRQLIRERTSRGLSQREAANLAGLARSTIGVWETGDAHPTLNVLDIYLTALGLELHLAPRGEAARAAKARLDAMSTTELLTELIGELASAVFDEPGPDETPVYTQAFHDVSRCGTGVDEPPDTEGVQVKASADDRGEAVKAA